MSYFENWFSLSNSGPTCTSITVALSSRFLLSAVVVVYLRGSLGEAAIVERGNFEVELLTLLCFDCLSQGVLALRPRQSRLTD